MDADNSSRPRRRTALTASELSRYNIGIAALSETRLADEGSLNEIASGYTFFSGKGFQQIPGVFTVSGLPFVPNCFRLYLNLREGSQNV